MTNKWFQTPLKIQVRGRFYLLLLILAALTLAGCEKNLWDNLFPSLSSSSASSASADPDNDPVAAYHAALEDAKTAEPDEIVTTLTAITSYNPDIIRDGELVLMATWTNWDGYENQQGNTLTLKKEVWSTVSQELRVFCLDSGLQGEALDMRLRQLLGLPPDAPYDRVVELWVHPKDMFRPTPDPEISDHEAQLDFPGPRRYINITATHKRWFERNKNYGEDGYPWTRLGYTYDWGNSKSEVGLSEFVIRRGAKVKVRSTWETDLYCTTNENIEQTMALETQPE